MRSRVLAASMSLALIVSGRVVVQTIQDRPTDHDHPPISLPGARQLAVKPFTTLPKGVLFLRLENFSTTKAAQDAATSASAVVEWAGKIWLLTLGPKGYGLPVARSSRRLDRFRRFHRQRVMCWT